MIRSELLSFSRPGGEVQRVQLIRWEDWSSLRFFRPEPSPGALEGVAGIYRRFLIPACPAIFGQLLLFRLPGEGEQTLRAAAKTLRRGLRLRGGSPFFHSEAARLLWQELERGDNLRLVRGKLPFRRMLPVSDGMGLLSGSRQSARLRVNASFFIFDPFDCATRYDTVGTPFGLAVQDGAVLSPPLHGREALLVYRDGRVRVESPGLEALRVRLGGRELRPGTDCAVFQRPACGRTPPGRGWDHVIVGRRLVDLRRAGGTAVPASGFVLRCGEKLGEPGDEVAYAGMEELLFAIQVGNSLVRGGRPTEGFVSTFYNVRRPWRTPYPPSLYPLDYEKARAARIALGADAAGRPMLLWAEGAAKIGHRPGEDSCGASLSEFAAICAGAGMVQGVNLDGGGSAQILLDGKRALFLSDRDEAGNETERAIPLGLMIE